jgi:hypothetical protein
MTTPTTVPVRLQLRADTAANWTSVNPILLANELGRETDTGKIKIGNGTSTWTSLAYQAWATLPVAVNAGGTGQTSYTNGQLLIGNTTGNTLTKATLTAGSGVAITNGTGSITVAVDSTVVTTAQTGTVTSTMIADGTIVDADVNASAAIAGTKISPDFGSQNVVTTGDLQGASINGGPLAGFRNAIINGNFDIWQRGTSFTGNEYGADRWLSTRNGSTHTVTRQSFAPGQTDVPGEPTYFSRTAVVSAAGAGNFSLLEQRIEGVRTLAGQQITVSFWAKADASKDIAVELSQAFGSGGTPSTGVTGIAAIKKALTTTWQKITHTLTLPSISGKTIGTDNNDSLTFHIWFDAGSNFNAQTDSLGQQSGTFDIAQVQIEAGPVATPFERRPIGTELALCQRYAIVFGPNDSLFVPIGYGRAVAAEIFCCIPTPVPMRVIPSSTGNYFISRSGANVEGTLTPGRLNGNSVHLTRALSPFVSGDVLCVSTASTQVILSAEL